MLMQVIEEWKKHDEKPRVILHSCCAPCSTYTLEFMCNYADITILLQIQTYIQNMSIEKEVVNKERL